MPTEMGEYIVGAYLKLIENCDVVDYNVREPGGGLAGQPELDVVGMRFQSSTAFLCEVATHLKGINYGDNQITINRIKDKFSRQKKYATTYLAQFQKHVFMLWSPYVPKGIVTNAFERINGLEFVINREYTNRVAELRKLARKEKYDAGNPAFRVIQIMESLK